MDIGFQIVETVLYMGLAAMIIKIVVMPAVVDIVKQTREIKEPVEKETNDRKEIKELDNEEEAGQ